MVGQQCGTHHPPGSTKNGNIILNIKFNNYILEKNMARARKEGQVCGSRIRVGSRIIYVPTLVLK